jgi:hypothetical protein
MPTGHFIDAHANKGHSELLSALSLITREQSERNELVNEMIAIDSSKYEKGGCYIDYISRPFGLPTLSKSRTECQN